MTTPYQHKPSWACGLRLRFNFITNTWEVYNYLSKHSPHNWKWFSITTAEARTYAGYAIPVSVEDTVTAA